MFYISIISIINSIGYDRENTIYLTSNINEVFATTRTTQYFTNPLDSPIELSVSFPNKEEINLSKFVIKMGEKVVLSKIMEKEKAEKKYEKSIKSGNIGFISKYEEDEKVYMVNIGNIFPNQTIELNAYFIQTIGTQDMSYEFVIMEKYPTFHYKELNINNPRNKKIIANFIIETQSKITRLIAPFYDEEAKKNSIYEVSFINDYKKANILYVKNPDNETNEGKIKFDKESGYPGLVNQPTFLTSFCILFRTANMNKPTLFYQYNPELKETSYSINYVYSSEGLKNIEISDEPDQNNKISYYSKYQNNMINEAPGLFIFLIDQSGSMYGEPIKLVKKSLLLLVKSLPKGSYFQFIGFGTDFTKYNSIPVEYEQENINQIIEVINNLDADMGGTNIGSPLKDIYESDYSNIKLSKNILILTDGQVNNREECVDLITKNSNQFRVHAIGIGAYFDKLLIERSGKLGKGSSSFVRNITNINLAVIDTLNKCLRPYITDIDFYFNNYQKNIKNNIIIVKPDNNFSYQDEIISYSFILKRKDMIDIDKLLESINIEISAKNIENKINILFDKENNNIIRLSNGEEMAKMIIGKAFKYNKEFTENTEMEVEFSKKYQILSKSTALYAEIINDKNDSEQNELIKVNLNYYKDLIYDPSISDLDDEDDMKEIGVIDDDMKVSEMFSEEEIEECIEEKYFEKMEIEGESYKEKESSKHENEKESFGESVEIETKDKYGIDLSSLIMEQDSIEGFWSENEETKKLIKFISEDKIIKINNRIKQLFEGENQDKIKYTILVIYYLNNNHSDKLDEYKLIINKAIKFLKSKGLKYEYIIEV